MSTSKPFASEAIPYLEPSDRLTRDEFERRYEAMPNVKKAELIEGVVYISSSVRFEQHGEPHAHLNGWIGQFKAQTSCVSVASNTTVRLDWDNELQPDAIMILNPGSGGQTTISDDDYVEGAPEFVAEVAATSASFDLHTKKNVYRRNGVREYLVWRVLDRQIDWFALKGGVFEPLVPDASGIVCSEVFPGLWLDVPALLRGDLAAVIKAHNSLRCPNCGGILDRASPSPP